MTTGSRLRVAVAWLATATIAALACSALAHPPTERYIPFGYWTEVGTPNVLMGTIESTYAEESEIVVRVDGRTLRVRTQSTTTIWLEAPRTGTANRRGSFADCQPGVTVELRLRDDVVDWIKIRAGR